MNDLRKKTEELLENIFNVKEDTIENIVMYKNLFDKNNKFSLVVGDLPDNFSESLIIDSIYSTDLEELVTIIKRV